MTRQISLSRILGPGGEGIATVTCVAMGYPDLDYDIKTSNEYVRTECLKRNWYGLAMVRPQWSAERLGHAGNIREIKEIRRRYPRVVLVIAHLGRCYAEPHAREALPALADASGTGARTSTAPATIFASIKTANRPRSRRLTR